MAPAPAIVTATATGPATSTSKASLPNENIWKEDSTLFGQCNKGQCTAIVTLAEVDPEGELFHGRCPGCGIEYEVTRKQLEG